MLKKKKDMNFSLRRNKVDNKVFEHQKIQANNMRTIAQDK